MPIDLTGRRAVVTGSTSGMGFAIARGLADAGAAVVTEITVRVDGGINRSLV
jgi:NAD(P)-dependent dehydrogenase (short-subunit alcohol dehydrogenase family)